MKGVCKPGNQWAELGGHTGSGSQSVAPEASPFHLPICVPVLQPEQHTAA